MSNQAKEENFEAALKELEDIVAKLEGGDLPLERSLELFERGVQLTRICQKRLGEAEQKVEMLVKQSEQGYTTVPFEGTDET